ncbi:MAG TPA: polysaccharide deacetylase family protein [Nitrospiraceae bacterium]|nr:polysaccharide deacetylase family protein [Nitrospiraceae bacterium]
MAPAKLRRIIITIALMALVGFMAAAVYVSIHPIPVVLMFHSVVQQPQGLDVSPAGLASILDSVRAVPHHVIATTDSSDRSVYETFAPGVQERRRAAILFLMPPLIERNGMMTWDQVRELDRAGLVIASHTLTHPWLPDLSEEELGCELCVSKQRLEAQLGHAVTAVAYPYGAFNQRVKRVTRECGYTAAYSTAPGRRVADDDPLAIKRVTITEATVTNPLLRWLALSGYWVAARETLLAFAPIEVPRKPYDWSYEQWRKTVKMDEFCREAESMSRERR